MGENPTDWPDVHPPERIGGEQAVGAQRARLRAAIERLHAARDVREAPARNTDRRKPGADDDFQAQAMGDDRQAAEADMLSLLMALKGDADEAQRRLLPED